VFRVSGYRFFCSGVLFADLALIVEHVEIALHRLAVLGMGNGFNASVVSALELVQFMPKTRQLRRL
jgi:hypothetical protein